MDSRTRRNPPTIFEAFAEIRLNENQQTYISWLFPSREKVDEAVIQNMQLFAFPTKTHSKRSSVTYFSFVLTDLDGLFKFGFCCHMPSSDSCMCFVSWLPWFDIFYKLLERLGELCYRGDVSILQTALSALHSLPVPLAGHTALLPLAGSNQSFTIAAPSSNHLPRIPDDRNLTEYFSALDVVNMTMVYASMLHERRILFISSKLGRLTSCVHASSAFLYPMFWQHLFIPVLPPGLQEYCTAPMPYIIGVHSSFAEDFLFEDLEEVVVVNVDKNEVRSPHNDVADLPDELIGIFQSELNLHPSMANPSHVLGDKLARAFLRANVALIGGYRDALKFRSGSPISFDAQAFVESRPAGMRAFLERVLQLQLFVQFITERLNLLNTGQGFTDEFENESTMISGNSRAGSRSQYHDWLAEMRKVGRKSRQEGRDKWSVVANKFVLFQWQVLFKGKRAYKGIRQKLDDMNKVKEDGGNYNIVRNKGTRVTLPTRPTNRPAGLVMTRQSTVPPIKRSPSLEEALLSPIAASHGTPLSRRGSKRVSADDSDIDLKFVGIDLSADPDIQRVLMRSHSIESLLLDTSAQKEQQQMAEKSINDSLDNRVPVTGDASDVGQMRSAHSSSDTLHSDTTTGDYSLTNMRAPVSLNSSTSGDSLSMSISDVVSINHSSPVPRSSMKRAPPPHANADSALETNIADSIAAESESAVADDDSNKGLLRQKAFYRTARPLSVVKRSAIIVDGGLSLREARAHFMQSEVTRPTQFSPHGFGDSLAPANRIALDRVTPFLLDDASPAEKASSRRDEEETVLKSWKLTRPMSASVRSPTLPLTPNVNALSHQRTAAGAVANSPTREVADAPAVAPTMRASQLARQMWIADGSHQLRSRPLDSRNLDLRSVNTSVGVSREAANVNWTRSPDVDGRLLTDRAPTNGHMTDYQSKKSSQSSAAGNGGATARLLSPPPSQGNNHVS